jgi:hypothetical protein
MQFDRRFVLKAGAAVSLSAGLPRFASGHGAFNPQPAAWRTFEIVTKLEIPVPNGKTQAWVPVPAVNEPEWFKSLANVWTTNGQAMLICDAKYGAQFVHVEWKESESQPAIEVISRISTRDRAVDLSKPGQVAPLPEMEHKLYTEGTELIPVDGLVKGTSDKIVAGKHTSLDKARAIYEWIVDNTFRNPKTRGCGVGDAASMLKTGNLSGKCADLNALYVGLVRAAGIPARDVYGIRVAPSRFGYKSLGTGSAAITKAQHCRAETYIAGLGWIATDPADVRKVVLEEPPGNLAFDNPKVVDARTTLFGAWEGNWLAYNVAHDLVLPGSKGPTLGFLMYPQAECNGQRLDCLDPDTFRYTITSKELTSA